MSGNPFVGEQPFLAAGFLFLVVMAMALLRLGRGAGGRHWAAAWLIVWIAGGPAMLRDSVPAMNYLLGALGAGFAGLFFTGTLRFVGREVPAWMWAGLASLVVARSAVTPFISVAASEALGAILIWCGALGSSALLLQRRADGYRTNGLLAAVFPAPAIAGTIFAWVHVTQAPLDNAIFVWLMAGIGLSGMQVISFVSRIAERSEAERAVLASLIESVPVGLALFDRHGALRAANHAFQKLTGHPTEPARDSEADLLETLAEQVDPADLEAFQDPREDQPPGNELRMRNGLRIVTAVHTVSSERDDRVGRLWLLRDVTEERRLQESLERARRLETLGGFAGGVAHDFNNQLTSVLGNAVLARETLPDDHPAREILADLASSAEYCARLTRDVLDFARRGPGRPVELDLATLLPEILERCGRADTLLEIAPATPPIHADAMQVERVVANLADNARHAAGPDGRVELHVQPEPESGRVILEVRDDGPGIEEQARPRIFDPFFTTKPVGEGSGLGLAIVYGIVTGQGGEVRVECPPGGGTRIVTTWPVANGA